MKKVAIAGVEGSGKTVFLAAMGARYETPDANGLFLAPLNHDTYSYCRKGMAALRKGQWPLATSPDVSVELTWQLMEKSQSGEVAKPLAQLSFLDFAGEVYRKAFGGRKVSDGAGNEWKAVDRLKSHVRDADVLIVLVDLGKIINGAEDDERAIEMNWLSQAMLSFASGQKRRPEIALVFTQVDRYLEIIRQCGGERGALAKYLPIVDSTYGNSLPLFSVAAVDTTSPSPDDPTVFIPAPDFGSVGFDDLMAWMREVVLMSWKREVAMNSDESRKREDGWRKCGDAWQRKYEEMRKSENGCLRGFFIFVVMPLALFAVICLLIGGC